MLIDMDSKPTDTVFYIAIQLHNYLKDKQSIKIIDLELTFNRINSNQPVFKYYLALNLLFLLNKVRIVKGEICYVSS